MYNVKFSQQCIFLFFTLYFLLYHEAKIFTVTKQNIQIRTRERNQKIYLQMYKVLFINNILVNNNLLHNICSENKFET
jgi:hypothetical protein